MHLNEIRHNFATSTFLLEVDFALNRVHMHAMLCFSVSNQLEDIQTIDN
jgi:hypothetical protein